MQAALAVGAVREGHATATTKDRNTKPVRTAGNWGKASLESNLGEPGEDACEAPQRATPPDEGRYRERRIPRRTGTEFGCKSEDVKDGAGDKYSERKESAGRRGVPSAGGRARAERGQRATYGGSFYHDSRRELELMPTLRELDVPPEHPGSPVRSDPPYRLPQTPQGDTEVKLEPTDATASQPSPTTVNTTTERGTPTNARHVGDTASPSRAVQNTPPDQARWTSENPSTEHRPAVKNKNKTATREAGEGEAMETADRAATATAAGDVGCLIPKEVVEIGQMTSFKVAGSRPKGGTCTINSSEAPGRAPTAWPRAKAGVNVDILDGGTATEVVDADARGGQQLVLIGLSSKRRGTPAAGNVTASTDPASAHHVHPERAHLPVPLSLKENGNDRGKDGGLSPAPYDGSSLFSVQQVPSSTTPAASEGLKGPPCHASALQDHGKQPSRPLPGLEGHAANPKPDESASFQPRSCGESTGLVTDTSSGGCSGQLARMVGATASHEPESDGETYPSLRVDDDPKMVQKKSLHPDWGRDGVKRKEDLDGNGRAPLREDCCSERRKGGGGREAPTDDVPMSFEAASATIFDELLEPRVVAVYSR